jgi:hypothetical protein
VSIGVEKRVNINNALVFDYNHIGVQIEGLELVKDDDRALIQHQFVKESDVGSLKGLLAHVQYGAVALVEVDLKIQGVLCPHRYFFL